MSFILIITIIAFITLLIGVIVTKNIKENSEIDYRTFFILGICFFPLGIIAIVTKNPGFIGISGLVLTYIIIGLANRNKWKKSQSLTPKQRKFTIGLTIIPAIVGICLFLFLLTNLL